MLTVPIRTVSRTALTHSYLTCLLRTDGTAVRYGTAVPPVWLPTFTCYQVLTCSEAYFSQHRWLVQQQQREAYVGKSAKLLEATNVHLVNTTCDAEKFDYLCKNQYEGPFMVEKFESDDVEGVEFERLCYNGKEGGWIKTRYFGKLLGNRTAQEEWPLMTSFPTVCVVG